MFTNFRDKMQGVSDEDWMKYKEQYICVLMSYDLYENKGGIWDM